MSAGTFCPKSRGAELQLTKDCDFLHVDLNSRSVHAYHGTEQVGFTPLTWMWELYSADHSLHQTSGLIRSSRMSK